MTDILVKPPVTMRELLTTEFPPISSWIEPGVLPKGGKLLFGGLAKIGKSFLSLNLARSLVTGENPFSCGELRVTESNIRVQLIEQELGSVELQKRSKDIFQGCDPEPMDRMFCYSQERGITLDDNRHIESIIARCKQNGANVLILDPVGKMHHYDENSNADISRLFDQLEKILDACRDTNLSIVLSHHFGKPPREPGPGFDPYSPYNFRGASKWFDDPDTLVTVVRSNPPEAAANWWYVKTNWETRRSKPPLEEGATFSVHKEGVGKVSYEPEGLYAKKLNGWSPKVPRDAPGVPERSRW